MVDYKIVEITPDRFEALGAPTDWKSSIDKDSTVGICVFARGAGEGNTYKPGSALDSEGNPVGEPLMGVPDLEDASGAYYGVIQEVLDMLEDAA